MQSICRYNRRTGRAGCKARSILGVSALSIVSLLLTPCAVAAPPVALPPDARLAAELLAIGGEGFKIRETDHFTICYDTPYESLRPLIGRLEGIYDAVWKFCDASDLAIEPPAKRFQVILYDDHADFVRYLERIGLGGSSMAGVYYHPSNIAAFCSIKNSPAFAQVNQRIQQIRTRLDGLGGRRSRQSKKPTRVRELELEVSALQVRRDSLAKRFNRVVIQHEAAHQLFYNLGVHVRGGANPMWLAEGLACQFEVPQPATGRSRLHINHLRLADFRDTFHLDDRAKELPPGAHGSALAAGRFVPLSELLTDPDLFTQHGADTVFHYGQAWALVHYLYREQGEALAKYLQRLSRRKPQDALTPEEEISEFTAAFGRPDRAFQRAWVDYVLKLRFDPREAGR